MEALYSSHLPIRGKMRTIMWIRSSIPMCQGASALELTLIRFVPLQLCLGICGAEELSQCAITRMVEAVRNGWSDMQLL